MKRALSGRRPLSPQPPRVFRPTPTGGLFSPFFTFLRAIFFRWFRLSLAPTICRWASEDATNINWTKNVPYRT